MMFNICKLFKKKERKQEPVPTKEQFLIENLPALVHINSYIETLKLRLARVETGAAINIVDQYCDPYVLLNSASRALYPVPNKRFREGIVEVIKREILFAETEMYEFVVKPTEANNS